MIYDILLRCNRSKPQLFLTRTLSYSRPSTCCLAPVTMVCKQLHSETQDMVNADLIKMYLMNQSSVASVRSTKSKAWSCLSQMHSVHLGVTMISDKDSSNIARLVATAWELVLCLRASSQLRSFSFMLSFMDCDGEWAELCEKNSTLRRKATREGVKAGRNAAQREMDYALMAIEMIKEYQSV